MPDPKKELISFSAKVIWLLAIASTALVAAALFFLFHFDFALAVPPVVFATGVAYSFHVNRLAEKTREILHASKVHLETVEALATAIDARGQVDVGHLRRTQIYAVGIGEVLGLSSPEIEALRTGALLHDIGKLAIPDNILNKPERLTSAEFEKTKIHPLVGAAILEKVDFTNPVVETIKHHHERWDGGGYPEGRRREEIPLTARILSAADAFDTLRSARPYRPAIDREKARQIIQSEAGGRFDPSVVEILMHNLSNFETEIDAQGLSYTQSRRGSFGPNEHSYFEQIKLANREAFSLFEIAREFSASTNLEMALDTFAAKLREFVPFDTCAFYLLDDAKQTATAAYVVGWNAELLESRRIKMGQGATGFALKQQKLVQNVDPDLDFAHSQLELAGQFSTIASLPLMSEKEVIGAVTLYSRELRDYGEDHIRLLETISGFAADAIGKSLRHDEARTYALTDPMTGLPNARGLQIHFDKEVARASRSGTTFQILMLDLDGFKLVNDTFGHKVGDQMLHEVSRVIKAQLRDYDFLARYGGDEFVALVPETMTPDVAELCDRIERAVTDFRLVVGSAGKHAQVGVSLGGSCFPGHGDSLDSLIALADKAMYARKTERKRNLHIRDVGRLAAPPASPASPAASATEALIVELDETHVITSSAIN